MEHSLTIEAFYGTRIWRVLPGTVVGDSAMEAVLTGAMADEPWVGESMTAACVASGLLYPRDRRAGLPHRHPHLPAPVVECTCGIYASKTPLGPPFRGVWARGTVRLWGTVIEGEYGYRSEHARPEGTLELIVGMGPGAPRCTQYTCRNLAEVISVGPTAFTPRCRRHGAGLTLEAFTAAIDSALRRRHNVGVKLVSG